MRLVLLTSSHKHKRVRLGRTCLCKSHSVVLTNSITVILGHRTDMIVDLELDVVIERASVDMIYVAAKSTTIRVFLIRGVWKIIKHENLL